MGVKTFTGLALAITLALGGCSGKKDEKQLYGKVTLGGQPLPSLTLVVTGPDGQKSGGSTNANGEYLIPDPPVGLLKFQFIALGKRSNQPVLPQKYASPESGVTVEYTGGKKKHDIDLQP